MDEKVVKRAAWEAAVEHLISLNLAVTWRAMDHDVESAKDLRDAMVKQLQSETFPDADPATSDMLASEVEAAVTHILDAALSRLASVKS